MFWYFMVTEYPNMVPVYCPSSSGTLLMLLIVVCFDVVDSFISLWLFVMIYVRQYRTCRYKKQESPGYQENYVHFISDTKRLKRATFTSTLVSTLLQLIESTMSLILLLEVAIFLAFSTTVSKNFSQSFRSMANC